jgi:hypothetical protein
MSIKASVLEQKQSALSAILEDSNHGSSDAIFNDLAASPKHRRQSRKWYEKPTTESQVKKKKPAKKKSKSKSVEKTNYFAKGRTNAKHTVND